MIMTIFYIYFSANTIEPTLQLIEIFFDTATFDAVENDIKVTLEAQLGLIGGTMGLLTGFSIISGVEILYYGLKLLLALRGLMADYLANMIKSDKSGIVTVTVTVISYSSSFSFILL